MSLRIVDFTNLQTNDKERIILDNQVATDGATDAAASTPVTTPMGGLERRIRSLNEGRLTFLINKKWTTSHAEQDVAALKAFIGAMSSRYGETAARFAAKSVMGIDDNFDVSKSTTEVTALTSRKIADMLKVVETYHGTGSARELERHAVLRFWPGKKASVAHSGHAAMSLKDGVSNHPCYISWWPNPEKTKLSTKTSKLASLLQGSKKHKGAGSPSYHYDKLLLVNQKARKKLKEGTFTPRPRQRKVWIEANKTGISSKYLKKEGIEDRDWTVSAEKVYLPMIGTTSAKKDNTQTTFLFGLSESDIKLAWKKATGKPREIDSKQYKAIMPDNTLVAHFRLVSKEHNCSGMMARMLEAGGASLFLAPPKNTLYADPNSMKQYALNLEKVIAEYNQKADKLLDARKEMRDNDEIRPLMEELETVDLDDLKKSIATMLKDSEMEKELAGQHNKLGQAVQRAKILRVRQRDHALESMLLCKDMVDALTAMMGDEPGGKLEIAVTDQRAKRRLLLCAMVLEMMHRLAQNTARLETNDEYM